MFIVISLLLWKTLDIYTYTKSCKINLHFAKLMPHSLTKCMVACLLNLLHLKSWLCCQACSPSPPRKAFKCECCQCRMQPVTVARLRQTALQELLSLTAANCGSKFPADKTSQAVRRSAENSDLILSSLHRAAHGYSCYSTVGTRQAGQRERRRKGEMAHIFFSFI